MTTGIRRSGEICWFNMLTPEPANARAFFAEVLGWTYVGTGFGHTVQAGGRSMGALYDLEDPHTPKGTPPSIGVMIKVDRADDGGEKVRQLGGKARPAFNVGGAGRMAVCHDPTGAELDLWEGKGLQGTDVDSDAVGAPTWCEAITTDLHKASTFYAALFGWTEATTGLESRVLRHLDAPVAGLRATSGVEPEPRWATYFAVEDVGRTVRRCTDLGATVFLPMTERNGRPCAGMRSPQGVPFYVMGR